MDVPLRAALRATVLVGIITAVAAQQSCLHTPGADYRTFAVDVNQLANASVTECSGSCILLARYDYGEGGDGQVAGLCLDKMQADDRRFYTQDSTDGSTRFTVCDTQDEAGALTYGGTWWLYSCCTGTSCELDSTQISADLVCAEKYPYIRAFKTSEQYGFQSVQNNVSVQFATTATIPTGTKFTISGIRGTNTTDDDALTLFQSGSDMKLVATGKWAQDSGTLEVTTQRDVYNNETVSFLFTVENPSADNAGQNVTLSCSDIDVEDAVKTQCASDDWAVTHNAGLVGISFTAPVCNESNQTSDAYPYEPFFGDDCDQECFGVTIGDRCQCLDGQAGLDCNETLEEAIPEQERTFGADGGDFVVDLSSLFPGLGSVSLLSFPPGAFLGGSVKMKVYKFKEFAAKSADPNAGYKPAGPVMDFGPNGLKFLIPVTLLLPVDPTAAVLPAGKKFTGAFLNIVTSNWEELTFVGMEEINGYKFAKIETTHFTNFASLTANAAAGGGGVGGGGALGACLSPVSVNVGWTQPFCASTLADLSLAQCGVRLNVPGSAGASAAIATLTGLPASACIRMRTVDVNEVDFPAVDMGVPIAQRAIGRGYVVGDVHEIELAGGLSVQYTGSDIRPVVDLPSSKRRTATSCPEGFEYRVARLGTTFSSACSCPPSCGPTASCDAVGDSGLWTTVLVPLEVCAQVGGSAGSGSNAVVIGVLSAAAVLVLLVLGFYAYRGHSRKKKVRPQNPCAWLGKSMFCSVCSICPLNWWLCAAAGRWRKRSGVPHGLK